MWTSGTFEDPELRRLLSHFKSVCNSVWTSLVDLLYVFSWWLLFIGTDEMTEAFLSNLQGRSACGVTRSLRTAATRWWSSLSEPSCTPRTANSSTSSAPEFQVRYRSYIHMQPSAIKNGCECLRGLMHLWMIHDCENASAAHAWCQVNGRRSRFRATCSSPLREFGCGRFKLNLMGNFTALCCSVSAKLLLVMCWFYNKKQRWESF